jgi:hypothetical protein
MFMYLNQATCTFRPPTVNWCGIYLAMASACSATRLTRPPVRALSSAMSPGSSAVASLERGHHPPPASPAAPSTRPG